MHDTLRITPTFRAFLHAYREKHIQGNEVHLLAQRRAIIDVVLARFPDLEPLAQQQAGINSDAALLAPFVTRLVLASNEQEAKSLLISIQPGRRPLQEDNLQRIMR